MSSFMKILPVAAKLLCADRQTEADEQTNMTS